MEGVIAEPSVELVLLLKLISGVTYGAVLLVIDNSPAVKPPPVILPKFALVKYQFLSSEVIALVFTLIPVLEKFVPLNVPEPSVKNCVSVVKLTAPLYVPFDLTAVLVQEPEIVPEILPVVMLGSIISE